MGKTVFLEVLKIIDDLNKKHVTLLHSYIYLILVRFLVRFRAI